MQGTELRYRFLKSYKEIRSLINKKINRFFYFKKWKGKYFLNINEKRSTDKTIFWQAVKSFKYRVVSQLDIFPRTDPWITLSQRTLSWLTLPWPIAILQYARFSCQMTLSRPTAYIRYACQDKHIDRFFICISFTSKIKLNQRTFLLKHVCRQSSVCVLYIFTLLKGFQGTWKKIFTDRNFCRLDCEKFLSFSLKNFNTHQQTCSFFPFPIVKIWSIHDACGLDSGRTFFSNSMHNFLVETKEFNKTALVHTFWPKNWRKKHLLRLMTLEVLQSD